MLSFQLGLYSQEIISARSSDKIILNESIHLQRGEHNIGLLPKGTHLYHNPGLANAKTYLVYVQLDLAGVDHIKKEGDRRQVVSAIQGFSGPW
ncbi:MAG: hypothetical protein OIF35_01680 [Cellvibrionaceae bacterium]|nr:hypothetical protein [Cellvibrionaceae bacterium]MCV6624685.1 hypothetical protein [Cellvibrionaceae bacterium]